MVTFFEMIIGNVRNRSCRVGAEAGEALAATGAGSPTRCCDLPDPGHVGVTCLKTASAPIKQSSGVTTAGSNRAYSTGFSKRWRCSGHGVAVDRCHGDPSAGDRRRKKWGIESPGSRSFLWQIWQQNPCSSRCARAAVCFHLSPGQQNDMALACDLARGLLANQMLADPPTTPTTCTTSPLIKAAR